MDEKKITNINIENILPNRMQPRIVFDDEYIDELADSIKKHGIINPITVRRLGDKFEIIAGERRFKACKSLGLKEIPAIIIEADDKKTAELALIENIQRKELSPIEEGMSYEKILQIGDMTQAELSKQLGKKQSTIANKIRLLKLDDSVKEALLKNQISERHARSLLKLYDKNDQKKLLTKIINERLTVRQTDKEIEKIVDEKGEMIEMDRNIPENNIILNNEEEIVKNPEEKINPSFVDIKKEEKSEDIFKEKPTINIEDLLKPSSNMNINKPVESAQPKVEETTNEMPSAPTSHKFFGFFPQEDTKEEKNEESPAPMSFNINDIETKTNDEEELPKVEVEQIEEPEEQKPTIEVPNVPETVNNQEETIIAEPKEEKEPEFDFNNFNPMIHNDFANDVINDDDIEFIEEEEEEKTPVEEVNAPKQMKDVIKVLRDCNDIIESYGYRIETEEFDLETMYQAIFKIYKN